MDVIARHYQLKNLFTYVSYDTSTLADTFLVDTAYRVYCYWNQLNFFSMMIL